MITTKQELVEAHRNNIIIKLNAKNSVGIAVKLLQA
jgi:DNA-binding CsgD family transcriptional regulator